MTHSHTPNACPRNLGVTRDLKYNLGNTRVTWARNFSRNIIYLMLRWTRSWVPDEPIACAKVFFILPSKPLFFIYNSHDLKKSIGNLKCETSSWSRGHFTLINTAWGSRVIFLCHVRPKKGFYGSFRPSRLIFKYVFSPFGLILCTYFDHSV